MPKRSNTKWLSVLAPMLVMLLSSAGMAQIAKDAGEFELPGKWPTPKIPEGRYATLECPEHYRLWRHQSRADKVVCVAFSAYGLAVDCEGGRSDKQIVEQRGRDYCTRRDSRLHSPLCPPIAGTGGKRIQPGRDSCEPKGSSTSPKCEKFHAYQVDQRGNEDLCLPAKWQFKCKSGYRLRVDDTGVGDRCRKFTFTRPELKR